MKDVFDQSGPERLVAGGVWFLTLMVLCGIFGWVWSVIVSRTYGPVGYGIFNTAQSLYTFAWAFIFGGLFGGLIKYGSEYVVKRGWELGSYFSTALKYLTAIGVIVFLILVVLAFHIPDPIMKITVLSIGVSFLFSGTKDALASVLGSFQKSNYLSIIDSSKIIIILVVGVMLISFGFPSYTLPVLLVVGTVWQLAISAYFLRSRLGKLFPFSIGELFRSKRVGMSKDFRQFAKIFGFGFFVSLAMISFNVMKSLDIVVIKMFFDYADVGVYSVADTTSSILFYMTSFSLPIIPAIAEAYAKRDKQLLGKYVKIAIKYPLLIGIPLTLIILSMAQPLILVVYGAAFAGAVIPLQILIIGTFMLMFSYNLSSVLVGMGKPKLSGLLMSAAAIQYSLSLFVLVPLFGFTGAALALTLTGFTSMLLVPYFLKKELKVSVYNNLPKVLLPTAIMAFVLFLVPKSNLLFILLGVVVSIVLFTALLRLTGYLTREDLKMIKIAGRTFGITRPKIKLKIKPKRRTSKR